MGSSEVMGLPHANAIPLKKQQQTAGKRGMRGGGQTPLLKAPDIKPGPTKRSAEKLTFQ
jgi:hypothetical protein